MKSSTSESRTEASNSLVAITSNISFAEGFRESAISILVQIGLVQECAESEVPASRCHDAHDSHGSTSHESRLDV